MANTLIHESRRLLLPFDSVVDALIELEIKHGRWPANAALVDVSMHEAEEPGGRSVVLSIRPPQQEAVVRRTYPLPLIAAAIVNYCLTMHVPMPRSSSKAIEILPEGIALHLENTLMLQRRHAEAPPVRFSAASGETAQHAAVPVTDAAEAQSTVEAVETGEPGAVAEPGAAGASEGPPSAPQA